MPIINLKIANELRRNFKIAVAKEDTSMREKLIQLIEKYLETNG